MLWCGGLGLELGDGLEVMCGFEAGLSLLNGVVGKLSRRIVTYNGLEGGIGW
jgi:hypothetical protein